MQGHRGPQEPAGPHKRQPYFFFWAKILGGSFLIVFAKQFLPTWCHVCRLGEIPKATQRSASFPRWWSQQINLAGVLRGNRVLAAMELLPPEGSWLLCLLFLPTPRGPGMRLGQLGARHPLKPWGHCSLPLTPVRCPFIQPFFQDHGPGNGEAPGPGKGAKRAEAGRFLPLGLWSLPR